MIILLTSLLKVMIYAVMYCVKKVKFWHYTIQKGTIMDKTSFSPQIGLEFVNQQDLY